MPENTPTISVPSTSPVPGDPARRALRDLLPEFYAAVSEFEDLKVAPGLSPEAVAALETKLDFSFSKELKELLTHCAAISMAGLSVKAAEFGPIVMPGSDALIIGEFYLHNPGDRLLMLPDDPSVYYLEQRNGAITTMADGMFSFFNKTLLKYMYSD